MVNGLEKLHRLGCSLALWGVLGSSLFSGGCAGLFEQLSVSTSSVAKISDTNKLKKLEGKVCVLPARVNSGQETYRNVVSDSFANALEQHNKKYNCGLEIVSASDFLDRVRENNLYEEYEKMMDYYTKHGLLKNLEALQGKIKEDYFVVPFLLKYELKDDTRISFLGVRVIKTKTTSSEVYAEIWDKDGRKRWGRGKRIDIAGEKIREKPVNFEKVLDYAWKKLLEDLLQ